MACGRDALGVAALPLRRSFQESLEKNEKKAAS
jgi:hypothetical protein